MTDPRTWTWAREPIAGGRGVIVDVDGVIADATHRQHHLDGPRRDWRGFFGACDVDPPIEALVKMVGLLDAEVAVILLTARPHYVHAKTVEWLGTHDVRWDLLVMRSRSDEHTSSSTFKRRSVTELVDAGFTIEVAIDDDVRNIEMYREIGLPAVYIHSGYYD